MGELIGISSALIYRGNIKNDFNNYTITGIYNTEDLKNIANSPEGGAWSIMIVIVGNSIVQVVFEKVENRFYIRTNPIQPNYWTLWRKV